MAWPSTLTWKLAEPLQKYLSKFSPFNGQDWKDELDNIYNTMNYLSSNGMGEPLASIAALRLVPPESTGPTATDVPRRDKQLRRVDAVISETGATSVQLYQFRALDTSLDADSGDVDSDGIVKPDDITHPAAGRWIRVPSTAIYQEGVEALRTMKKYLYVNLAAGSSDVAFKLAKRSAGTYIKYTADAPIQLRNSGDSDYQDLFLKILNASSNIIGAGTNNQLSGTPTASAIQGLLQLGSAPVGASSSGNYRTINSAAGFAGLFDIMQMDGATFLKVFGSYIAATKALLQLGGDFSGLSANGQMQVINAPNAFSGYLQAWLVDNVVKNIIYADGRMKGTAGSSSDEFVIKSQMESAIAIASVNTFWGDGSDGDVTISGTTTLTRDMYYNNLTIDVGGTLITAGYIVHVKNTATINGTLDTGTGAAGSAGSVGSGAPGALPGAAGGAGGTNTRGTLPVQNGVAGGAGGKCTSYGVNNSDCNGLPGTAGVAATNVEYSGGDGLAGSAGGAGNGGSVGAGGAAGVHTRKQKCLNYGLIFALTLLEGLFAHAGNGAGGGGSSAFQSFGGDIGAGGGGGGTGAAAQTQLFLARILIWGASSIMKGVGGAGGAGGAGEAADPNGASGGGGGGGDGGNGALAMHLYNSKTGSPNTTNLAGGAAGAAGAAGAVSGGSSSPGAAGTIGTAGRTGVLVNVALAS